LGLELYLYIPRYEHDQYAPNMNLEVTTRDASQMCRLFKYVLSTTESIQRRMFKQA